MHVSRTGRIASAVAACALAATATVGSATAATVENADARAASDVAEARALFGRNLAAIRMRDRDAYLACYRHDERLARTGFDGPSLGFDAHAAQASDDSWPDVFEAHDLRLVPVSPGVVYGTYRYRVVYAGDEHAGISERLFLDTADGWRIAMTSAFDAPPATPPPPVALVGATLIDGTGASPVADAVVVVRGGRIECAGTRADCPVPAGVQTVIVSGLWIVPGLIDAHVHFSQTGWADGRPDALDVRGTYPYEQVQAGLRAHPERYFRAYLCSGVTAAFDVGGYPWTWELRERTETDTLAPHVSAAGPLLSTIDFWLNLPAERQFIGLDDAAGAADEVRYLATHGAAAVKVWFIDVPDADFDAMAEAVAAAGAAADEAGLPLIVHATGLREAKAALRAGADVLVHSVWDQAVDDEFLALARENRTVYCPTLTVIDGYRRMYDAVLSGTPPEVDDPNGCVDRETLRRVAETATLGAERVDADRNDRRRQTTAARIETMKANLKTVHDAGIPVAMGTDAGNPLTLHGPSVYAEMEAMQAAGLTPTEVVVASTRGAALAMGRLDDLGTVEAGKAADVLVVGADPTTDVAHLRRVRLVMRGGVIRSVDELREPAP